MNLREVEDNLAAIDEAQGFDLLYELLLAYGLPKASISRLKSGSYDKAEGPDEHLWKRKVYFRRSDGTADELYGLIEAAREDERVKKELPRFLIVANGEKLLARDNATGETLDISPAELQANATFFLPWAGIEKTALENVNLADIKAAEKMAKLYDEITRHNSVDSDQERHDLNVFFSRLLFCFFAEDTNVFEEGSFTNALGSFTQESGNDTDAFLDQLFEVLDTEPDERDGLPGYLQRFGYVNGKLFQRPAPSPTFSAKARAIALECGTLDWSQINPDIFGSMMQAVVRPSHREGLGMHYTSVENIMKVIRPLFLDELTEALRTTDKVKKLERLLDRIAEIQVFDPACGSGNFLVIAYKELRKLEHGILTRIAEFEPHRAALFQFSRIDLGNFYGIEIDDFATEVATLSLWLAKHQMNREFMELFGVEIPLIPLVDAGRVECANAATVDWISLCRPTPERETFVCGNPPYLGARLQTARQKRDFESVPEIASGAGDLDYIAIWIVKAARYVAGGNAVAGLVATNSISQGTQVALLWPAVYELGVDIAFAVQSFRWSNQARGKAGVTCVIVGLTSDPPTKKLLYGDSGRQEAVAITPYLTPGSRRTVVRAARKQLFGLPTLTFGSMPNDGGGLILSRRERDELIDSASETASYIKRFAGADEFIKGKERYCLWIADAEVERASGVPAIADRLKKVREHRSSSKRGATRKLADAPHRFGEIRHRPGQTILVPGLSSERREYIPFGFVDDETIISNLGNAIYEAELWLLGLISARMHMVWVAAVGGRLETRYRYSPTLVYNTFPPPELSGVAKEQLSRGALAVLSAREQHPDHTLEELYDPETMPSALRAAHADLDAVVESLYRGKPFATDDERLQLLFDLYEAKIEETG